MTPMQTPVSMAVRDADAKFVEKEINVAIDEVLRLVLKLHVRSSSSKEQSEIASRAHAAAILGAARYIAANSGGGDTWFLEQYAANVTLQLMKKQHETAQAIASEQTIQIECDL